MSKLEAIIENKINEKYKEYQKALGLKQLTQIEQLKCLWRENGIDEAKAEIISQYASKHGLEIMVTPDTYPIQLHYKNNTIKITDGCAKLVSKKREMPTPKDFYSKEYYVKPLPKYTTLEYTREYCFKTTCFFEMSLDIAMKDKECWRTNSSWLKSSLAEVKKFHMRDKTSKLAYVLDIICELIAYPFKGLLERDYRKKLYRQSCEKCERWQAQLDNYDNIVREFEKYQNAMKHFQLAEQKRYEQVKELLPLLTQIGIYEIDFEMPVVPKLEFVDY